MTEKRAEYGTEIAPRAAYALATSSSIFFDVAKFEHAQRVAKMLSTSTMIPEHFRDNLGNIVIALNYAERIGADPFMCMQNMYVVHGRPGIEGKLVIALVNQCGRFAPLKFRFDDSDKPTWCECFAKEISSGDELIQKVTWAMVQAEGWDQDKKTRTGSIQKSKWNTLRPLMFQYRSATYFARVYCPEVLLGMQTVEEIHDFVDMTRAENGTYAVPQTTSDKLQNLKQSQPKPETTEGQGDAEPPKEANPYEDKRSYARKKSEDLQAWNDEHASRWWSEASEEAQGAFRQHYHALTGQEPPQCRPIELGADERRAAEEAARTTVADIRGDQDEYERLMDKILDAPPEIIAAAKHKTGIAMPTTVEGAKRLLAAIEAEAGF